MATASWIELDGAVNARVVVPGVLLRADNLQALSARDIELLSAEHRLEVVVDLRTDVEVAREGPGPLVGSDEVRIEHRSLYPDSGGSTDVALATVAPWYDDLDERHVDESPIVRAYLGYLERRPDSIVAAIRTIAGTSGAILVHCAAGKDRTGVVVALALDAAGVPRSLILADYLATGERMDLIIDRLASSETYRERMLEADREELTPKPATLERVLERVDEQFGGSAAWLLEHGLTDDELDALRRRIGSLTAG
jgi:protein tyrosine/serine phosphatase